MNIYTIILAGGSGTRLGAKIPKQFLKIKGTPIIIHTIRKFSSIENIDGIIIVTHPDYINLITKYIDKYSLKKVIKVIEGGKTRQQSSYNALNSYKFKNNDILLFHDAVRPFINKDIIKNCIEMTTKHDACTVSIKAIDTIIIKDNNDYINHVPDRNFVYHNQTPQCFKFELIYNAHKKAIQDNISNASDDVFLVLNYGKKVKIVEGSYNNIKITNKKDLILAKYILENDIDQ